MTGMSWEECVGSTIPVLKLGGSLAPSSRPFWLARVPSAWYEISCRQLLVPIHGNKGVVGSSLSVGLSTLIRSRVVPFVVLLAVWESFASTFFRCNHLLHCSLEFFGGLRVVIAKFFKLPPIFDPIIKVVYHLPVYDIIDLGS